MDLLPSAALEIGGKALEELTKYFRTRVRPVIGRVAKGHLILDCRCLERGDEEAFIAQLS